MRRVLRAGVRAVVALRARLVSWEMREVRIVCIRDVVCVSVRVLVPPLGASWGGLGETGVGGESVAVAVVYVAAAQSMHEIGRYMRKSNRCDYPRPKP